MNLPFKIDLSNKVAVVTGGGGILCSNFAKVIAECGAKVAILDLNGEAANKVADEINAAGGTAIGVATNVLPSTGITLPFISRGATSLGIVLCATGVLLSISARKLRKPKQSND